MNVSLESMHVWGITVIQQVQLIFQDYSGVMLFLSYIGDPKFAFTFYFPVTYFLHQSIGKRVLWVTVIAEWLNAVAKWLLHGERPYWWVYESEVYENKDTPHLKQFDITCETGPGSPSGHAMITGAALYIIVSDFLHYRQVTSKSTKLFCWSSYTYAMCAIAVSRLFIATHFPHQVVAGILAGILIGKMFNRLSTSSLKFHHYVVTCVGLTLLTVLAYMSIKYQGSDPQWSVGKAVKWCADRDWVHLDTTVFYSLIRDISSLFGLGVAVWLRPEPEKKSSSLIVRCLHIAFALAVTSLSESVKPARDNLLLFYMLGFFKHTVTVCIIVVVVPMVSNLVTWV